jgi:hypothetical protein
MKIQIEVTDLQHDGMSWSTNSCWANRYEIEVPDDASELSIVRRIKATAGIQGMRRDEWSGCEWSFRNGNVGASAWVVD